MTSEEYRVVAGSKDIVKGWSGPDTYNGPEISTLLDSIYRSGFEGFTEDMVAELCWLVPAYFSADIIKQWVFLTRGDGKMSDGFDSFCKNQPELVKYLKVNLSLHSGPPRAKT